MVTGIELEEKNHRNNVSLIKYQNNLIVNHIRTSIITNVIIWINATNVIAVDHVMVP